MLLISAKCEEVADLESYQHRRDITSQVCFFLSYWKPYSSSSQLVLVTCQVKQLQLVLLDLIEDIILGGHSLGAGISVRGQH